NFRGPAIVAFLERLHTALGPMTVVWDQIIIHSCALVEQYLPTAPGISLESFPPYAPELNPVDDAWFYIKYDRIPNFAPSSTKQLRRAVDRELKRLRTRPDLLRSFIEGAELPSFL